MGCRSGFRPALLPAGCRFSGEHGQHWTLGATAKGGTLDQAGWAIRFRFPQSLQHAGSGSRKSIKNRALPPQKALPAQHAARIVAPRANRSNARAAAPPHSRRSQGRRSPFQGSKHANRTESDQRDSACGLGPSLSPPGSPDPCPRRIRRAIEAAAGGSGKKDYPTQTVRCRGCFRPSKRGAGAGALIHAGNSPSDGCHP